MKFSDGDYLLDVQGGTYEQMLTPLQSRIIETATAGLIGAFVAFEALQQVRRELLTYRAARSDG